MQQPTSTGVLTTYGPIALSALVVIGVLVGWLIGRIDTTAAMSIIIPILASWGVVGISLKQSLSAIQGTAMAAARRPVVTGAYIPPRASAPDVPPRG